LLLGEIHTNFLCMTNMEMCHYVINVKRECSKKKETLMLIVH